MTMSIVNDKIPSDTKKRVEPKKVGRPRAFEPDAALDQATRVFWAKGYAATSLDDLTTALTINRPSLYATFGNKEALFGLCLDAYARNFAPRAFVAMNAAASISEKIDAFFATHLHCIANDTDPAGCFINASLADEMTLPDLAKVKLHAHLCAGEEAIQAVFVEAQEKGEIAPHADTSALASLMIPLMHGLAVQARSKVTKSALELRTRIATKAMLAAL
jgi:TetR/AcrR family transcriptional regulator, copper-responsive repressor